MRSILVTVSQRLQGDEALDIVQFLELVNPCLAEDVRNLQRCLNLSRNSDSYDVRARYGVRRRVTLRFGNPSRRV